MYDSQKGAVTMKVFVLVIISSLILCLFVYKKIQQEKLVQCLVDDIQLSDLTFFRLPNDDENKHENVAHVLDRLEATCKNGKFFDSDKKEIYFYKSKCDLSPIDMQTRTGGGAVITRNAYESSELQKFRLSGATLVEIPCSYSGPMPQ